MYILIEILSFICNCSHCMWIFINSVTANASAIAIASASASGIGIEILQW